ncbi:hypothetical protein [Cellulomonas dongxiuzhuiae]|uniref:Universal stress protein n=1 Tax=Cellulomonas dongxiuzhuiae TaxID=2819979 RepID=A0ABX8GN04_9CELL|nr:hypothetical protein [Cellulomonas dongxiuzhuiae]MBO3087312.1 hypothetical protein [Cellulomonas dongxiuzhuiae]MBO3093291.1 hypothetical protein [Cellulomonas dongxiuzhuiae]QWC17577.1 hypothetical protein KKR89_08470 [Cellulomonas dongxiuzhuiae]
MTDTILVLTEDTLAQSDVRHIVGLHPDEAPTYRVLVPADTERPLVPWIIDALSMGELREAWDRATGHEPDRTEARQTAAEQIAGSVAAFEAAGRTATGEVTDDDPLPALRNAVARGDVREVVVVTYPHMVEDTFHTDWASRAREELHVPVLHLYAGTSELG